MPRVSQDIAEVCKSTAPQLVKRVRESFECGAQSAFIIVALRSFDPARLGKQQIIEIPPFAGEREPALLDLAETRGVGATLILRAAGEGYCSSMALKLVCRSKSGTLRRGGPSMTAFALMPRRCISA